MSDIWKATKPFVTGSISGSIATCCIQPMDMVKVRVQVNASEGGVTSPFAIASTMIKEEGFMSLYKGLTAGLTRQVLYTGARLGLYDQFTDMAKSTPDEKLSVVKSGACALAAGGLGACIGNPADLALIRMQTDSMLPIEQRAGYTNVVSALSGIISKEGFLGIFAGVIPTSTRAMALNLGMLAGNSVAKDALQDYAGLKKGTNSNTFCGSAIAGFLGAFFCIPFDYVKTQIQKQKPDPKTGELPFKGTLDCFGKTLANKGVTGFYAGFPVFYFRIAPHAMITLIAQDKVKAMWTSMGL